MSDLRLFTEISSLPTDLKQEISDFVKLLKLKTTANKPLKERQLGCAKGLITLAPDFDEPLDDFKEYM